MDRRPLRRAHPAEHLRTVSLLSAPEPVRAVLERPHGLLEGPRIAPGGEMVYSDVLAGGVYACSPAGDVRTLLAKRRGIGGIVPHADGGGVISGRSLIHLLPSGEQRELLADEGACGFNDLASTASGELLAGMLRYRPMAGEPPREGALLLLGEGIGLAPDRHTVYLSDYAERRVLVTDLDGAETREFARSPKGSADGLAVDAEGGVWVALGEGGGVARFEPGGRLDEVIAMPAAFVSSLSFGGPDLCDVLITTADNREQPELGGTLLRARSELPGLPVYPVGL
jgi:gluconolactonase